jgi:hypothetical protein
LWTDPVHQGDVFVSLFFRITGLSTPVRSLTLSAVG